MGRVGGAVTVDPSLVRQLIAGGFVPVISPLARDADDAGGAGRRPQRERRRRRRGDRRRARRRDELVLVADVPGVLDDGTRGSHARPRTAAAALIASGVAAGGMAAKLEAAAAALRGGVARVRIAGLDGIGNPDAGTRVVLSPSPV